MTRLRSRTLSLCASLCACLGSALVAESAAAQATHRGISIGFESIRILDEDDPVSDDEPYLIVTRFELRTRVDAVGRVAIVPGTLKVDNIMSGHNNLGRRGDNWADEVHTYNFPPRYAQNLFRWNEDGWVIGAVVTLMEEDGFSDATADRLGEEVRKTVERTFRTMTFDRADARNLANILIKKISHDLSRAARRLDIPGIVRGLISAVDPDDYGGSQIVLAVTAPGNKVFSYIGLPTNSPTEALTRVREVRGGSMPFSLDFPAGDLRDLPGNARFQGRHRVNGALKIWQQEPLY